MIVPSRGFATVALLGAVAAILGCGQAEPRPQPSNQQRALSTLRGIPQDGSTLGSRRAPKTVTILADLTSPGFLGLEKRILPRVITRHVRPGRVRLQVRALAQPPSAGIGSSDGQFVAQLAQSAGLQDRLWDFLAVFADQYVNAYSPGIAETWLDGVPGLDVRATIAGIDSRRVVRRVRLDQRQAPRSALGEPICQITAARRTRTVRCETLSGQLANDPPRQRRRDTR